MCWKEEIKVPLEQRIRTLQSYAVTFATSLRTRVTNAGPSFSAENWGKNTISPPVVLDNTPSVPRSIQRRQPTTRLMPTPARAHSSARLVYTGSRGRNISRSRGVPWREVSSSRGANVPGPSEGREWAKTMAWPPVEARDERAARTDGKNALDLAVV